MFITKVKSVDLIRGRVSSEKKKSSRENFVLIAKNFKEKVAKICQKRLNFENTRLILKEVFSRNIRISHFCFFSLHLISRKKAKYREIVCEMRPKRSCETLV